MSKVKRCLLAIILFVLGVNQAMAMSVTQIDTVGNDWLGFSAYDKANYKGSFASWGDYIGIPNIMSATFDISNHKLVGITINMQIPDLKSWTVDKLMPGDIFINLNARSDSTNSWDYIIHNTTSAQTTASPYVNLLQPGASVTSADNTLWTLYSVKNGSFDYGYKKDSSETDWNSEYVMSQVYNQSQPIGKPGVNYIWRYNHPVEALDSALNANSTASTYLGNALNGWTFNLSAGTNTVEAHWNLLDGISLRGATDMLVSFGPSCANDIYYEDVRVPNPEPGTMLLMGIGVAGVAFMRKRTRRPD